MATARSGLFLFSRYAFACAEDKVRAGMMTQIEFDWLKKIADGKLDPNGWLLEYRFKKAMESYRQSCKERSVEADFSLESVADYWRHYHGHSGDCAVSRGRITELDEAGKGPKRARVEEENHHVSFCFNPYNLKIDIGDWVFVHHSYIIETDDATSR